MTAEARILFAIGARLGMPASAVECLSVREIVGWAAYFSEGAGAPANDDATEVQTMSRAQLRALFPDGRR